MSNTTLAQSAPLAVGEDGAPYDQLMEAAEGFQERVEREGREVEHLKEEIAELKAEAHALADDTGAASSSTK